MDLLSPRTRQAWRQTGQEWLDLLDGPSVAEQMAEADELQRAALARGGVGELMQDPAATEATLDAASNVDFTGALRKAPRRPPGVDLPVMQPGPTSPVLNMLGDQPAAMAPGPATPLKKPAVRRGKTAGEVDLLALDRPDALFDYRALSPEPRLPGSPLPRPDPPKRGYPDYVMRVVDPKNIARMRGIVERGMKETSGPVWYDTGQLRDRFIGELGDEAGDAAHKLFINLVGGTSPRQAVDPNIRSASYYFHRLQSGLPLGGKEGDPLRSPSPYSHMVEMGTWRPGIESMLQEGHLPYRAPKTPSFAANLMGNWEPLTADVHNVRAMGLTDAGGKPVERPNPEHYSLIEKAQADEAKRMGIHPAQWQASAWFGHGLETGLRSDDEPFLATVEKVVRRTAEQRGQTPEQVFRDFLRGKAPLLGIGGATAALIKGLAGEQEEGGT